MIRPVVVGLLGRAGSGKSTSAAYAISVFGGARYSFAAPLKDLAKILWDLSEEQVRGSTTVKETVDPRIGLSPRDCMIRLGDGVRRTIGDHVWIEACFRKTLEPVSDPQPRVCFVEDVRYLNEAVAIRSDPRFRGFVVKLICPDSDSTRFADAPSECSVDEVPASEIDFTIESPKTPDSFDLKLKVDAVVAEILRRVKAAPARCDHCGQVDGQHVSFCRTHREKVIDGV